nr:MAG TPA: hypothetical protein [Caudoviricetes sp.]
MVVLFHLIENTIWDALRECCTCIFFSPIKMLTTYALGKIDVCLLWSTVLCKICIVIYHIRKIIQFV